MCVYYSGYKYFFTYICLANIFLQYMAYLYYHVVVQSLSHIQFCDPMDCSTPISSVLQYLLEFVQIHIHWVGDTILPSDPLPSPSFALNLPQHLGLFQRVNSSHQLANIMELRLSICPSNEYSGLTSLRINWFDLLVVQETLKSSPAPQVESVSSLVLSFFMVQLSHTYMTIRKKHSFDYLFDKITQIYFSIPFKILDLFKTFSPSTN